MQNYTKYEKCLDTPKKLLYYYSNTKMKDLRMENLRFLNICLSAFFWEKDNDTITVNRFKKREKLKWVTRQNQKRERKK